MPQVGALRQSQYLFSVRPNPAKFVDLRGFNCGDRGIRSRVGRFRSGFYLGLGVSLCLALFCLWLWQPECQVNRHTENLFRKAERKDWAGVADFIDPSYADQWSDDRALVLERMGAAFSYVRNLRISATEASCTVVDDRAIWRGKIKISAEVGELGIFAEQRINSLAAPFELEWRHASAKPWNWKLFRVGNPDLEIPADF